MRFTIAATAAALVAGASAYSNATVVYVTDIVSEYTTYCPVATSITQNGVTYTISEATTLTITDCPCTVTYPSTSSATAASTIVAPIYSNGTSTTAPVVGTATSPVTGTSTATPFTGAGNKYAAPVGGLAAIFGLAAYAL